MIDARDLSIRLAELLRRERGALADFVIALAEFDRGRRWLELGYPNLFQFLVRDLGLSNGGAYHRKIAAELLQRYPEVLEPLRDGRLCVSALPALAKVITPENRLETLPRFFDCSKRDAQAVAAEIMPVADAPQRDVIKVLRTERSFAHAERGGELFDRATAVTAATTISPATTAVSGAETGLSCATAVSAAETGLSCATTAVSGTETGLSCATTRAIAIGGADVSVIGAARVAPEAAPALLAGLPLNGAIQLEHRVDAAREVQLATVSAAAPAPSPSRTPQRPADELKPLTADLRRLHVTVSRRFVAKLDAARDALSHSRAGSTTEDVLEAALDLLLQQHARTKGIVAKPRRAGRQVDSRTGSKRREEREAGVAGVSSGAAAGTNGGARGASKGPAVVSSGGAAAGRNGLFGATSKGPAVVSSDGAAAGRNGFFGATSKGPAVVSSGATAVVSSEGADGTSTALGASSGEPEQVATSNITDRSGQRRDPSRDRADGTNSAAGASSGEPAAATRQLLLAAPPGPSPKSDRKIPASVRREVWKRDGGCCQWPLASGGICGSTLRLEFDHIVPRARGGPSTIANLRVLCRVHNQHSARRAFGDEWMDRYGRSGTGERNRRSGSGQLDGARHGRRVP